MVMDFFKDKIVSNFPELDKSSVIKQFNHGFQFREWEKNAVASAEKQLSDCGADYYNTDKIALFEQIENISDKEVSQALNTLNANMQAIEIKKAQINSHVADLTDEKKSNQTDIDQMGNDQKICHNEIDRNINKKDKLKKGNIVSEHETIADKSLASLLFWTIWSVAVSMFGYIVTGLASYSDYNQVFSSFDGLLNQDEIFVKVLSVTVCLFLNFSLTFTAYAIKAKMQGILDRGFEYYCLIYGGILLFLISYIPIFVLKICLRYTLFNPNADTFSGVVNTVVETISTTNNALTGQQEMIVLVAAIANCLMPLLTTILSFLLMIKTCDPTENKNIKLKFQIIYIMFCVKKKETRNKKINETISKLDTRAKVMAENQVQDFRKFVSETLSWEKDMKTAVIQAAIKKNKDDQNVVSYLGGLLKSIRFRTETDVLKGILDGKYDKELDSKIFIQKESTSNEGHNGYAASEKNDEEDIPSEAFNPNDEQLPTDDDAGSIIRICDAQTDNDSNVNSFVAKWINN